MVKPLNYITSNHCLPVFLLHEEKKLQFVGTLDIRLLFPVAECIPVEVVGFFQNCKRKTNFLGV